MKQLLKRLPAVVVLAITPVLTVLISIGVLWLVTAIARHGRWRPWDAPPGEMTELVTADDSHVVVDTKDGTLYEVWCRSRQPDDVCWQAVDEASLGGPPCREQTLAEMAPPPAGTQDHIATCVDHEYLIRTQYALLEDGTLWSWRVGNYPLGQVAVLFRTVLGGLAVGVVMGIVLLRVRQQT